MISLKKVPLLYLTFCSLKPPPVDAVKPQNEAEVPENILFIIS